MRANDIYRVRRRDIPSKAAPAAFDGVKGHANQAIPHRADVSRAQGMNGVKIDVQNEFCVKIDKYAQRLAYVKKLEVLQGHRTGETAPPRRYVRTVVRITRFHTEKQINLLFYVGNLAYSKIL